MATSGTAWGTLCSIYSELPILYIRKQNERHPHQKTLEGIVDKNTELILVDDLIFNGESKREAIAAIKNQGQTVTDIIVVIDRQLQK
jgi:uridine monophosphate synthetase